ncbi:hypothetical protein QJS04_geneDACA019412 [Acorus gramineus]|uniref:PORR domain-containing protein n=1 Tax=Acorus gramineus TaxID=55184 RepID=A0AAV9ALQ3_ACOGR|nr:hypothetical protein QJS04_geneDACA019412 [Acorus gramineus]
MQQLKRSQQGQEKLLLTQVLKTQSRSMTKSRRVQDRSKKKRIHHLEIAVERWKAHSKLQFLIDLIKRQPEQVIRLSNLERHRRLLSLKPPHTVLHFLRKSPNLFDLYSHPSSSTTWCGFTPTTEALLAQFDALLASHAEMAAERVARLLMMSSGDEKRLRIDKIAHFRREFGFPEDFRKDWIRGFPELFRVVVDVDGVEHLELVEWRSDWAVTELERRAIERGEYERPDAPGLISLPFPLRFPPNYRRRVVRHAGYIERFQSLPYLSPYADARGLRVGTREYDKRAVAVMHEILSFTLEKRIVVDHLTHFRSEFAMPQKLMRLLLRHFGVFYVSERGKRFSVFLTDAYNKSELIEKCPLVLWKEKVLGLTEYRSRKTKMGVSGWGGDIFSDMEEEEEEDALLVGDEDEEDDEEEDDDVLEALEDEGTMSELEGASLTDDSELDIREVFDPR